MSKSANSFASTSTPTGPRKRTALASPIRSASAIIWSPVLRWSGVSPSPKKSREASGKLVRDELLILRQSVVCHTQHRTFARLETRADMRMGFMPLVVTRRFASWANSGGKALRSIAIFAGRYPPIVLSIPSIYLLIFYPPLWKDIDAVCQLIFPADDMNILHFPPIYCFLGRIPFLIAGRVAEHGSHNSLPSLFGPQQPSLAGIYLLVVTQHLALIAALTYTVVSLTEDRVLRGSFAFVLASCSSFYTYAQCCGSEALSIIATFGVMGAGISIVQRLGLLHWYVYGAALFLAIGSRHLNLLFSIWLPLTLIVRDLARRFGSCDSEARNADWKTTGVAALVGVFAIGSNLCIARYMISAAHDEYRSTLGRTLSDRIGRFLDELPQGARLRLAQELSVKTPDPLVKMAVESQAITGTFYNGTGQKITDDLVRSGVPS